MSNQNADLIAYNGKIATQNEQRSMVEAVAVLDGRRKQKNNGPNKTRN